MKKLVLTLAMMFAILCGVSAQPEFVDGKKYVIQCAYFNYGGIALGAYHDVDPIVYYVASQEVPNDAYWYISMDEQGCYTFRNAQTMEYLVYDPQRVDAQKKGLNLSASISGNDAKWKIGILDTGGYYIQSVSHPEQYFNLRVDGTNLVGTYSGYWSSNSTFYFLDDKGNMLGGSTDTSVDGEAIRGDRGITEDGYYWERTGMPEVPIVASTASDPILYKIRNVRSGKYLVNSNDKLHQTDGEGDNFYFRKNGSGYSILTEEGKVVLTDYPTANVALNLKKIASINGTNYWGFNFYDQYQCPGYLIEKLTQRPVYDYSWWGQPEITNGQSEYLYWNDNGKKFVCLYDWSDLGSTFVFYSADVRHAKHLMENGVVFPGVELMGFRSFIDTLRINDKELIYDSADGVYVATVPAETRTTGRYSAQIHFVSKASGADYTMRIDGVAANDEGIVELADFDCTAEHYLNIYKDGVEIERAPIRFTFLNLVEVNYPYCNGSYYTTGSLRVTQANIAGYDSLYTADFRYRGATAQSFDKKSYAIKMREHDGVTSKDVAFLGLRDDNNWILDAMAVDKACMRNRVSTDLWNDFAVDPYHKAAGYEKKARHGTRGEFAEVYLNGKYHGIYCLTEKMDRKQLKLKKFEEATDASKAVVRGTLYKSSQWSYEVLMGHEMGVNYYPKTAPQAYDNNVRKETWANYEIKYPDWEEEPIDWGPLWNAINFVATTTDRTFVNEVNQYFDIAGVTDYYLFIELMLATDNHGKNLFFYNYDQTLDNEELRKRIGLAPWDLDGTWGRRWDGSNAICDPKQDFTTFLWNYEHGTHTLFHRLKRNTSLGWTAELAARYAELRETHFSEESLCQRFQAYADLFEESGAVARERKTWSAYHSNILGDVDYIKNWIADRLEFLDKQYGYVKPDGINSVDLSHVGVSGGERCIVISSNCPQDIKIYALNGQLVRSVEVGEGIQVVDGLAKGIYIVAGQKVLVR